MNRLVTETKKVLLLGTLLLLAFSGWAQVYKNGIRQGQIKVKFAAEMTNTLSQTTVNARTSGFITGIQSVDMAAKATKANNMYRLFPYDPKFEHKLRKHGLHLWYVVEIDETVDPKAAVIEFKQVSEITAAEVDHEKVLTPYTVKSYVPSASTSEALPFNDPLLKDQWHYNNIAQDGADVNLFSAWAKTSGANNIIVAVHDEGVDVNHIDLKSNIWVNQDEVPSNGIDDDGNGYKDDINGYNFEKNKGALDAQYHGTHVAGTIAAVNNNGVGVSGVAGGNGSGNGVKIMSLQIFGSAPLEKSYIYAANNGAVISQNSWGYTFPGYFNQSVKEAIDYFIAEAGDYEGSPMRGGIVIFAAGNNSSDGQWFPGYYESTFAVAALGPQWKHAYYSNFGSWVEVSAPGGDQDYGLKSGVLSTIPNDQYAYLQGTSMACPHVSGIAALALANRTKQLTQAELWNKLYTGVVSIDSYNPEFLGKLGSGAIDASLAIMNDQGKAPVSVTNLAVTGVAQEFMQLSWSVPSDEDDIRPLKFDLYYHTQPITQNNLVAATKITLTNSSQFGEIINYELGGLLGLTTYHFAITSTDRWGNVSLISNVVTATTNDGPSIAVDENSQSIELTIDASTSTVTSANITILNQAAGILRWNHVMRHKGTSLSFNASALRYPNVSTKNISTFSLGRSTAHLLQLEAEQGNAEPMSFTPVEKSLSSWPTNIIGETDLSLTNSAAAKFHVSEVNGFNLTQVRMYLKHDPAKGPVIVEVFKGDSPIKSNLIYAQEYSSWGNSETWANITLDEQLYFENGSTFWIALHVPANNLYPLGIGFENETAASSYCYISFNVGASWIPLEEAINDKNFAWSMVAASYNEHLGNYLTLEPGSGDVNGFEQTTTSLTANGATLINGSYSANVVLTSNDAQKRELRVPVNLTVIGHKPEIKHIDIADFGAVFVGTKKILELEIDNRGYGNFNNPSFYTTNPQFVIEGYAPWRIAAREKELVRISYNPSSPGNHNDILTITNGDQTYQIALTGVGAETSKIKVTPSLQVVENLTIGDEVTAHVTVENVGAYPLKYFIPGFDTKGISDTWPSDYHSYGYKFRTNYGSEANPLAYAFQDISATGVNINNSLKDSYSYFALDMGFEFPYYGDKVSTIYIAQKGFTTFDNSVNPVNTPRIPGNEWSPKGIISILGSHFSYIAQGEIFYQLEADRVIIQYNNVTDGYSGESVTAQMVLYANGDIRFFYETMFSSWNQINLNILIEDLGQLDGILVHDWSKPIELFGGLALGFDYPGPNIISGIQNGSGIIMPGTSVEVDINLATSTLVEGTTNRYINFISNDPSQPETSALIQLNITDGGSPQPLVSTDTIEFGNVFQGAIRSQVVTIKNPGTANVDITSMVWVNNAFNLSGDQPTVIKPALYKTYTISIPTNAIASLEDWLSINYADGSHDTIYVTGNVVVPPAIDVNLSLLQETLEFGTTSTHPIEMSNPGLADLEVMTIGTQWMKFETTQPIADVTYAVEKYNDGRFYQWMEIRETGTQLPFLDFDDFEGTFWRDLELPFPIQFYGETYTSLKIGDNGIISFESNPEASLMTNYIPAPNHDGPCIMPYWTFSGFSDYLYDIEDIGIFYKAYDDKFIITWSYFTNNFGGMGDPVSAQVIFYKNGTMKFQYKREEGGVDLTSQFGTIGLQKNSTTGIAISEYLPLDHGTGLAYVIVPGNKYVVPAGETLVGDIKLDATNIYGGSYNGDLKIVTNVPNQEQLRKPVELTVTGDAVFTALTEVDFGTKMVLLDQFGMPEATHVADEVSNGGSAPLEITWIQMADGTQGLSFQVYMLADGWFGPEWRWVDIAEAFSPWAWSTPIFTVNPGEVLKARAVFAPSYAGSFTDDVVFTTNIGEQRITLNGVGIEPPSMEVDETPISSSMNLATEVSTYSISISNVNGFSDLNYQVSIDFGRAATSRAETMATSTSAPVALVSKTATSVTSTQSTLAYNRIIKHTPKESPDTHVGIGGALTFSLATRFNAGPQGFNLSHIETWFRAETLTEGKVSVEIRAGGDDITTAPTIGQSSLDFTASGNDVGGSWHTIALDEAVGIYPNEDFFVVITYPLGIEYPQGTVFDEPKVEGRYYYFSEGTWYNVQDVSSFATAGWLMYAAEQTEGNTSWLSITSASSGTLAAGATDVIDLKMEAAYAKRGDQVAKIVVTSNDPDNSKDEVPVKLHMNEAPKFVNVPEVVYIGENEIRTLTIPVNDNEDNTFVVTSAQAYADVDHTFAEGELTITLSPEYGDEGNYSYKFTATDQHNAVNEITLSVIVAHTNRAPLYTGDEEPMQYTASGELAEYAIEDWFNDPDGDEFTFTIASHNTQVVQVLSSSTQFAIKPVAIGEAQVTFVVTDLLGASTTYTIDITVTPVLGIEDGDVNFSLTAYPNPSRGKVYLHVEGEISNEFAIRIISSMGVTVMSSNIAIQQGDAEIDLSHLQKGIYFIEITDSKGRSTRRVVKH